jgi:Uma2 family endonuclease
MHVKATQPRPAAIVYPESDGKPMADNTKQLRWITMLYGNLSALFRDRPDVFVGGDLLWYPVEGESEVRVAPDVLVVFGRPKGDRGSYRQWEEDNVPLTVVFEIVSPGNTDFELDNKCLFYEDHGVQEYYSYDPDNNWLKVFVRQGQVFRRVRPAAGFVSPRLGIRFDLSGPEMVVYYPDGRKFLTFEELESARAEGEAARQKAEETSRKAEEARQKAEIARDQAEEAHQKAEAARDQAKRAAARLAELSRKARQGQASAEELQELERLEEESLRPPS